LSSALSHTKEFVRILWPLWDFVLDFYSEGLLAHRFTPKPCCLSVTPRWTPAPQAFPLVHARFLQWRVVGPSLHPQALSLVCDSSLNTGTTRFQLQIVFSMCNLRARHAVVTRDPLITVTVLVLQLKASLYSHWACMRSAIGHVKL
jgi:hypothetical protein